MPTYEYRCPKCGEFELVQKISEDAIKSCPTCSSPVERLVSGAAFHLKGSGWYKTDYASGSSSAPTKTTASTETKSEAKTETSTPVATPPSTSSE